VVQVGGGAVECYADLVAAEVEGFVVEGLVEVADELFWRDVLMDGFEDEEES
jgi:hypothetical protein